MTTADHAYAVEDERRLRPLVTPEGVDLRLKLGSVGQRLSAFLIDVAILIGSLIALMLLNIAVFASIAASGVAPQANQATAQVTVIIWLLGFFVLRNGYFLGFELSARGATPGKRIAGLRVASRDGGRLRPDAVFARNAMREVELFLPLSFIGMAAGQGDPLLALSGLGWTIGILLLPLFTRDRLRAGDLIAGTWVVVDPRRTLRRDLAGGGEQLGARFAFTAQHLDAYGEHELQVLEDVLRRGHGPTMQEVAQRIRAKIGWTAPPGETDADFLEAFYAAERRKLETDLLFGRRRRDKNDRR